MMLSHLRNKLFWLRTMLLAGTLVVTAACAASPTATPIPAPTQAKASSATSSAASQAAAPQFVLKAGHNSTDQYPHGRVITYFAQEVGKRTNGRVKVEVFPNATLGDEAKMFEGLRLGTIDMAKAITSVPANTVPEFGIFDLPYLFKDKKQEFDLLNGPVGQGLLKKLEAVGVKGLFWMDQGTRSMYTSKKAVRSLANLKGMKIRAIQSPIMVDTINALGASATPMAFGELYVGLQQGVVDGAENSPDSVWANKHYEVAKYYSLTEHFRTPVIFMMSMQTWNKLPKDIQEAIDASSKSAFEWGNDLYEKEATQNLEDLKGKGMEVIKVDLDPFRAAVEPVYAKYAEKVGADLIKQIKGK
ncbi:MAG: TRAP transporter substrate-binding protein [Chloroflexi bacterium]|nr:TRAP transporter substrate-binding protein [Chloroflexota bacterium]